MQALGWLFDQFTNIFLKMTWLQYVIDLLLINVLGLDTNGWIYHVTAFFIYDVIKIFILLSVLIFISSYIQAQFTPERTKEIVSKYKGITANIFSALLGTLTPFCSCSSIPVFIGFTKSGLPVGVTFSFLISSPLVDLASTLLLATLFGWKIAIIYVLLGIIIAVIGGSLMDHLHMERYIEPFVLKGSKMESSLILTKTHQEKVAFAKEQVVEIIRKVYLYILIGVGIGAVINGVIPQAWIESILGNENPFSVIIATIVGIPMYADIFGTLPIAEALLAKGVGLGTVLSLMMAVTALSLPSMIMLRKVIKPQLLTFFILYITLAIIVIGYLFNAFGYLFI